jgi:hypothetical protein
MERKNSGSRHERRENDASIAPGAARAAADEGTSAGRRPFVVPRLTRHEPLTRITLVSGNDFPGSGGAGGTFFGG